MIGKDMKKYSLLIIEFLMRITGIIALAYIFGILVWIIGTVFYDIQVNIFHLWTGLLAVLCYYFLSLLRKRLIQNSDRH